MFSIFLNDIEMQLAQGDNECITMKQLSVYLLLFADDAVIFSETPSGLQNLLITLSVAVRDGL